MIYGMWQLSTTYVAATVAFLIYGISTVFLLLAVVGHGE